MKIAFGSDFHFEFYRDIETQKYIIDSWKFKEGTDLIIIAGDLHVGANKVLVTIDYIREVHGIRVLYVPGNHDYYGSSFKKQNKIFRNNGFDDVLLNGYTYIKGIRFFGCMGNIDGSWEEISLWKHGGLNDFHMISDFDSDHEVYGRREYKMLDKELRAWKGKSVVITHTMPSPMCISDKYKGSHLNPCFANDWEKLIMDHKPEVWICGHTHDSFDKWIDETDVMANPFGYPHENKDWEWRYIDV